MRPLERRSGCFWRMKCLLVPISDNSIRLLRNWAIISSLISIEILRLSGIVCSRLILEVLWLWSFWLNKLQSWILCWTRSFILRITRGLRIRWVCSIRAYEITLASFARCRPLPESWLVLRCFLYFFWICRHSHWCSLPNWLSLKTFRLLLIWSLDRLWSLDNFIMSFRFSNEVD